MIATLLGFILGLHLTLLVGLAVYSSDNESSLSGILLFQWCIHVCVIVIFHLLEFFVTAYCNSTVVSATSFVVDQSKVNFFRFHKIYSMLVFEANHWTWFCLQPDSRNDGILVYFNTSSDV